MITREQAVTQSVQSFIEARLIALGYTAEKVLIRDAFPTEDERATELTKTVVATGFNFDDGGRSAELGSDLILRVYTIEFWIFGTTAEYGQNVAHVIREILEQDYLVPLLDIRQMDSPEIDKLEVVQPRGVLVARQVANDPRPWDMNVWTTLAKLEDWYYPSTWPSDG